MLQVCGLDRGHTTNILSNQMTWLTPVISVERVLHNRRANCNPGVAFATNVLFATLVLLTGATSSTLADSKVAPEC